MNGRIGGLDRARWSAERQVPAAFCWHSQSIVASRSATAVRVKFFGGKRNRGDGHFVSSQPTFHCPFVTRCCHYILRLSIDNQTIPVNPPNQPEALTDFAHRSVAYSHARVSLSLKIFAGKIKLQRKRELPWVCLSRFSRDEERDGSHLLGRFAIEERSQAAQPEQLSRRGNGFHRNSSFQNQ